MTKQQLRQLYIQKRSGLLESEFAIINNQLYTIFFENIDLSSVKVFHVFIPIDKNKEPDTWPIVNRIQKEFPQIKISIPKINKITNSLENYYFEDIQQLQKNAWNILEPQTGILTKSNEIDMVIIPLLIFDESGNRVGYGKGYYDKFLSSCKPECKKIGLSLFSPVKKIDDIEDYDQKLNTAITPKEVFYF